MSGAGPIVAGEKVAYVGDARHVYNEDHYLCATMPTPVLAEVPEASPDAPLLGLLIQLDTTMMSRLVLEMQAAYGAMPTNDAPREGCGVASARAELSRHRTCQLQVATKRVGELDLPRRSAFGLEQPGAGDQDACAPRPRRRDVESVEAKQELHAARGVVGRRRRHRVDHHGGLLPLELVHGADARVG
ncbi:MAG: AraC family transcriptional regulator [Deltaproteobacteria bacterium]|nr:MAG: AraC family transcriptional regulator [Deltaproteobacteria bacterium]